MKRLLPALLLLWFPALLFAQNGSFPFGEVPPATLYMKSYKQDTSANAVIIKEFGRTYIDNHVDNPLIHHYHVRIKILNEKGVDKANFTIPLYKNKGGQEILSNVKGRTFNPGEETARLRLKDIYTENKSQYLDLAKFTLPNAKTGSVIEVAYDLSSPFIYNFRQWDFQSDIPKMYSEYWAKIPANLEYHISLIGFYKLTKNERSRVDDCLTTFNGGKADCAVLKLGMKDVPAFKEEKYMTAASNFRSSVRFELASVHRFNGSTEELAKTWDDVDHELKTNKSFGIQLKKGINFFKKHLDTLLSDKADSLALAKRIYRFIQQWYSWDGYTGTQCEKGIKDAFEDRKGNVADINLSLIAALQAAKLDACPVLISTRDNGLPHDLFPVISDFNYVLARLTIGPKTYLLDATRPAMPFGVFPVACINGRGRVLYNDKPSEWSPIRAPVARKAIFIAKLQLDDTGAISGTITRSYYGYAALAKREEMHGYNSKEAYLAALRGQWQDLDILDDSIRYLNDPEHPLVEILNIRFKNLQSAGNGGVVFNPFFQRFIRENPFKLKERHYPVDFGTPEKLYTITSLRYPEEYEIVSVPGKKVLALPENGGRYILNNNTFSNEVVIKTIVDMYKSLYDAEQYMALKEFYNRIIQSQRARLVLVPSDVKASLKDTKGPNKLYSY